MKVVAFVPARLTSTRLPEKHFKLIGDKPLLSWVIKRLRDCKEIDQIVVCAPDEPESKKLVDFCKRENVELYIHPGDVNDVVGRLTTAAKIYRADICVLASGDCPLLSSESIDKIVGYLRSHPDIDMAFVAPKNDVLPIHEGFNAVRRHVWELAEKYSDTPELREHQFPVLKVYEDKFSNLKRAEIIDDDIYYDIDHRISVDTPDDLEFMNVVYDRLTAQGKDFTLYHVIGLLKEDPSIIEINKGVHQKGLLEKSKKVLFAVSAVGNLGYGNLMRAIDIALSMVDMGIGVEFVVLDKEAKDIIEERNFKANIIDDLCKVTNFIGSFDAVLFDINKDIVISKETVMRLKNDGRKVIFIDNTKGGAIKADKIIIPTAHYCGEEYANLLWGVKFVVIRREIKRIRQRYGKIEKQGGIIRLDPLFRDESKKLWSSFEEVTDFSSSFHEKLASVSVAILHLGLSCYEAIYLETIPFIVPREEKELVEIDKFYRFLRNTNVDEIGKGSANIGRVVRNILHDDQE